MLFPSLLIHSPSLEASEQHPIFNKKTGTTNYYLLPNLTYPPFFLLRSLIAKQEKKGFVLRTVRYVLYVVVVFGLSLPPQSTKVAPPSRSLFFLSGQRLFAEAFSAPARKDDDDTRAPRQAAGGQRALLMVILPGP